MILRMMLVCQGPTSLRFSSDGLHRSVHRDHCGRHRRCKGVPWWYYHGWVGQCLPRRLYHSSGSACICPGLPLHIFSFSSYLSGKCSQGHRYHEVELRLSSSFFFFFGHN